MYIYTGKRKIVAYLIRIEAIIQITDSIIFCCFRIHKESKAKNIIITSLCADTSERPKTKGLRAKKISDQVLLLESFQRRKTNAQ